MRALRTRRIAGLAAALPIVTAVCGLTSEAVAQSLGMAPAEVRATFVPGEPVRFTLSVVNDGDAPVSLTGTVTDFWYNERNEKVFDPPGTHVRSAADWIEFVPREVTVPPRGSASVNVLVTPPERAGGGYYAVIFMESQPVLAQPEAPGQRALYTNMRLGALVLLHAQHTEVLDLEVDDTTLSLPTPTRPLEVRYLVVNGSNTHVFPHATLAVLDSSRRIVGRAEAEPRRLLPQQADTQAIAWPGALPHGEYLAILTLTYGEDRIVTRELPFTLGPAVR